MRPVWPGSASSSREQAIEIAGAVVVDAGQDIGEPGLGIDVVEPGRLDQRVHEGGALTTAIGAGEQPGLAAERNRAPVRRRCW